MTHWIMPTWVLSVHATAWLQGRLCLGAETVRARAAAGSVASLWQQAGRAGRREQPSLSIYIGFDGPLDQFFMHQPENLFTRPIETAQVCPAGCSDLAKTKAIAAG